MENMLLLIPMFGIVGLIYMFVLRSWVVKQDSGSEKMTKLAAYIKEGALVIGQLKIGQTFSESSQASKPLSTLRKVSAA